MNRGLREKRDRLAKRHDEALALDPSRSTTQFKAELSDVVAELQTICTAAETPQSDRVEVAKTYRWLGDALFDLSGEEDKGLLGRAVQAYDRSEVLLANEEAPVEKAKLDFNYANTLRCLSGGDDVGLLEAAEVRGERAVAGFESKKLRAQVSATEEMLRIVRVQLSLARESLRMTRQLAEIQKLAEVANTADAFERERIAGELAKIRSSFNMEVLNDKLSEAAAAADVIAKKHAERLPQAPEMLANLKHAFAEVATKSNKPTGVASAKPQDDAEAAFLAMMLSILKERLNSEERQGRVSKDRADQLRMSVFRRAEEVLCTQGDDLFTLQKKAAIARELAEAGAAFAMTPSWPNGTTQITGRNDTGQAPPSIRPSRGIMMLRVLEGLRSRLLAEKTVAMTPDAESQAGSELLMRIMSTEARFREYSGDEARVTKSDEEVWRLAVEVQAYVARHHLMLIRPIFQTPRREVDAHSVFFSGDQRLRSISGFLLERGEVLSLIDTESGDYAESRWSQLSAASIGVFDLGVASRESLAQVCYELGIALAIGKPVVILSQPAQKLPFDVGLKPHVISGASDVASDTVLQAIYQTLAQPLWGGAEAGLDRVGGAGLSWLKDEYPEPLSQGIATFAFRSAQAQVQDVTALGRALQQLLGMLGIGAPLISYPAWAPAYPNLERRPRCFHVMPFRPNWASSTRDLARTVCGKRGWDYVRGDESDEQRIIRAIWTEISSASAVIVDITDQNPNVALELGMTHAIGRPYRILAQGDVEKHMFPSIRKLQVHGYDNGLGHAGFAEAIEALLDNAANRQRLSALSSQA